MKGAVRGCNWIKCTLTLICFSIYICKPTYNVTKTKRKWNETEKKREIAIYRIILKEKNR